jgi:hypothetical protein
MTKSQLRQIIRESIKNILSEQGQTYSPVSHLCATIMAKPCADTGGVIEHGCAQFGTGVTPRVGDVFSYPNQHPGIKFEVISSIQPTVGAAVINLNKETTGCTGTPTTPTPPTGPGCISQRIQDPTTNAHQHIMNAPASNNWKNNTIQTFAGFDCSQVQSRVDSMLVQTNVGQQTNPGQFSGNNLARKQAKIDSLINLNSRCCSSGII